MHEINNFGLLSVSQKAERTVCYATPNSHNQRITNALSDFFGWGFLFDIFHKNIYLIESALCLLWVRYYNRFQDA